MRNENNATSSYGNQEEPHGSQNLPNGGRSAQMEAQRQSNTESSAVSGDASPITTDGANINFNESTHGKKKGKRTKQMPTPSVIPYGANANARSCPPPQNGSQSVPSKPPSGQTGASNFVIGAGPSNNRPQVKKAKPGSTRRAHKAGGSAAFNSNHQNTNGIASQHSSVVLPQAATSLSEQQPSRNNENVKDAQRSGSSPASITPKSQTSPTSSFLPSSDAQDSRILRDTTNSKDFSSVPADDTQHGCAYAAAAHPDISLTNEELKKAKGVADICSLEETMVIAIIKDFKHRGESIENSRLVDECEKYSSHWKGNASDNNSKFQSLPCQKSKDSSDTVGRSFFSQPLLNAPSSLMKQTNENTEASAKYSHLSNNAPSDSVSEGEVHIMPRQTNLGCGENERDHSEEPVLHSRSAGQGEDSVDGPTSNSMKKAAKALAKPIRSIIKSSHRHSGSRSSDSSSSHSSHNSGDNPNSPNLLDVEADSVPCITEATNPPPSPHYSGDKNQLKPATVAKPKGSSLAASTASSSKLPASKNAPLTVAVRSEGAQASGIVEISMRKSPSGCGEKWQKANGRLILKLVKKENLMLEKKKNCTECNVQARDITFLPCGHFITCRKCAEPLYQCPLCKHDILATVNTFLS